MPGPVIVTEGMVPPKWHELQLVPCLPELPLMPLLKASASGALQSRTEAPAKAMNIRAANRRRRGASQTPEAKRGEGSVGNLDCMASLPQRMCS